MIYPPLTAFAISFALTFLAIRLGYLKDHPGERSLHEVPVSRLGGVSIFVAMLVAVIVLINPVVSVLPVGILLSVFALFMISLLDDRFSLSPFARLVLQLIVVCWLIYSGKFLGFLQDEIGVPGWLVQMVLVLVFVWSLNLYNFMDGMDGFAGGMAVIGFSCLAWLGWMAGDQAYATVNLIIVMSTAGFLVWNLPPAKIFMGDSGSTVLGLLMAVMSLAGWELGLFPVWAPLAIFSPFWVDATYTLIRRVLKGERFWLPHRQHFYQRLVMKAEAGHSPVLIAEYGLMLLCSALVMLSCLTGVGYNGRTGSWILIGGWVVFYGLLIIVLERRLRK